MSQSVKAQMQETELMIQQAEMMMAMGAMNEGEVDEDFLSIKSELAAEIATYKQAQKDFVSERVMAVIEHVNDNEVEILESFKRKLKDKRFRGVTEAQILNMLKTKMSTSKKMKRTNPLKLLNSLTHSVDYLIGTAFYHKELFSAFSKIFIKTNFADKKDFGELIMFSSLVGISLEDNIEEKFNDTVGLLDQVNAYRLAESLAKGLLFENKS